jgi:hypothetical protein
MWGLCLNTLLCSCDRTKIRTDLPVSGTQVQISTLRAAVNAFEVDCGRWAVKILGWAGGEQVAQLTEDHVRGLPGSPVRHPHRAGIARTRARGDDADLHARDAEAGVGGEESAGPVKAVRRGGERRTLNAEPILLAKGFCSKFRVRGSRFEVPSRSSETSNVQRRKAEVTGGWGRRERAWGAA